MASTAGEKKQKNKESATAEKGHKDDGSSSDDNQSSCREKPGDIINPMDMKERSHPRHMWELGPTERRHDVCGTRMFAEVLTLVGSRVIDNPNEIIDMLRGAEFHSEIMRRDDTAIDTNSKAAQNFFKRRYGLDFTKSKRQDGIKRIDGAEMFAWQLTPDIQYRVYSRSSAANQPNGSVRVWMGGWAARINVDGFRFSGEFGNAEGRGRIYNEGAIVLFGDYRIQGFTEKKTERRTKDPHNPDVVFTETAFDIMLVGDPQFFAFYSNAPLVNNANTVLTLDHTIILQKTDGRSDAPGTNGGSVGSGTKGRSVGSISIHKVNNNNDNDKRVDVHMSEVWIFD